MKHVPEVLDECETSFWEIFGRASGLAVQEFQMEDAEIGLLTTGTISTTAREVVRRRREAGEKIGLVKLKLYPALSRKRESAPPVLR